MTKIEIDDIIKTVITSDKIYQVVNIDHKNRIVHAKNYPNGSRIKKLKLPQCYKTQPDGNLYTLPKNNNKNNGENTMGKNRNPCGIREGQLVTLKKDDSNELYTVLTTNASTCWIQSTGNIDNVQKGIKYYNLEVVGDDVPTVKPKVKEKPTPQPSQKQPKIKSMSEIVPKQTGIVKLTLKSGKVIDVPLMDYDEVLSMDVERLVSKTINVGDML